MHGNRIVRIGICGILADLLFKIDPVKFSENVFLEGIQKVIYASPKKALYGALTASILFWRDLSGALGSWGLDPNLYCSCVMNKTVDGKKCTIFWKVDDLNILHVRLKVVDGVFSQLTAKYGEVSELSSSKGRVYDYLGMRLDYGTKGN